MANSSAREPSAAPLALVIENSKLRSELLNEKLLSAQLRGICDQFDSAINERDAAIALLKHDLERSSTAAKLDATKSADKASVESDMLTRLGSATDTIGALQVELESQNGLLDMKDAEIARQREELSGVAAALRDIKVS